MSLRSSCSRYFRWGHLPRDAAKGMLIEESTAAEMRGKGKRLAGSSQPQTPKARFTPPQPKNDEKILQKITRSAEYAYLGCEPDNVNEVGELHGTPRKKHQNIISPGDVYGADEPRSAKIQRPTDNIPITLGCRTWEQTHGYHAQRP